MMAVYDVVLDQIGDVAAAADEFYWSAAGLQEAAENDSAPDVVDRNREHVIADWITFEQERRLLDLVVYNIQPAFDIEIRDTTETVDETTVTARTLQQFYYCSTGGLNNMTGMDPNKRYDDEDAGEMLAALQTGYSQIRDIQETYLDALELLLDHPDTVDEKVSRTDFGDSTVQDEIQAVEETMQTWTDGEYEPV